MCIIIKIIASRRGVLCVQLFREEWLFMYWVMFMSSCISRVPRYKPDEANSGTDG